MPRKFLSVFLVGRLLAKPTAAAALDKKLRQQP
jgi:hypothetical protein